MSDFSDRLKRLRYTKGESQKELAQVVGKSREAVAKYEVGLSEPDMDALSKLAEHFGVSVDYIVGLDHSDGYIIKVNHPGLNKFERYLQDSDFMPYMELAVKLKENGIDVKDIEYFVDNVIMKYKKKTNGSKQKRP